MRDEELLRYFRAEARELLDELTRALLELERDAGRADLIARCFRLAHTLKGAARAVRQVRIGELAHAVEDALAPHRESGDPVGADLVSDVLLVVASMRREAEGLGSERPPGDGLAADADLEIGTARVAIADLDALLEAIAEVRSQGRALRRAHEALDLGRARPELAARLARIERDLAGAYAKLGTLRLVPVNAILGTLELAARDAAVSLGKQVELEAVGADVRVEAQILAAARDALLHLVRNAVDHGIEDPAERVAEGKPPAGRILLRFERRGRQVAILCEDDGRGIDVDAVRRAAIERSAAPADEVAALGRDEALRLIFRAGVSTSAAVGAVSGRGVGLDVAREVAARFRGEVSVESEPGRGTTIGLELPVSLTSVTALTVRHDGIEALIPLDAVRATQRLGAAEIGRGPAGPFVMDQGEPVPFIALAEVLGRGPAASRPRWIAVLVQGDAGRIALGVDQLDAVVDVVVKPLPASAGRARPVAGATLDEGGDPLLVLDASALVERARAACSAAPPSLKPSPGAARERSPILIIDDSLTTRMLEQSILESAGYRVDLASSAEEGLEKAAARRYGLFIVDVQMAGMNGLQFTALTRADPELRQIPVMLVTSLASADDRRRGAEAGAAAYVVKGEFEQETFLRRVAELVR